MITVNHRLSDHDRQPMERMREAVAPAKGQPLERAAFDQMMNATPAAVGVRYEQIEVGEIPGWWCLPSGALQDAAVLYLHGGAYVVGSAEAYKNFVGQIAARAKVPIFIPDYGLAPERPFPTAVEDAKAAYQGLTNRYSSICIAGDSAGGGLALVLVASVVSESRLGNGPTPKAVAVMSPWTDLTLSGGTMHSRADADPLLTREVLASAAAAYLGREDPSNPQASPLFGGVSGFPPVLIHVGEDEVLLDDSRRFAEHLSQAKTDGQIHIWEGMTHVFPSALGQLEAAGTALDLIGEFLNQRLTVMNEANNNPAPIPLDNPKRSLTLARPDDDEVLRHVGVVGDCYTILVDGQQTEGQYCLIDMLIPKGGGPPPHRHDFEEMFTVLEGEIEATFRDKAVTVRAGQTINIPANAPHHFTNKNEQPARLLCMCTPAGQEDFFLQVGILLPTRTTFPPKLDGPAQAAMMAKAIALAPKYKTELLLG